MFSHVAGSEGAGTAATARGAEVSRAVFHLWVRHVVDGQQLTGDTLELVEQIGDGAYPYRHFSGIDVKGSAGSYTLVNEATSQATAAQAR